MDDKEEIEKRRRFYEARNKQKTKSKGLGDSIAKLTTSIGIKPCGGCKKRQKKLNNMFPYKR